MLRYFAGAFNVTAFKLLYNAIFSDAVPVQPLMHHCLSVVLLCCCAPCSLILLAGCNWWRVMSSIEQADTLLLEREVRGKGDAPNMRLHLVLKIQPHDRPDGPQMVSSEALESRYPQLSRKIGPSCRVTEAHS
jgi:hypothetical protein